MPEPEFNLVRLSRGAERVDASLTGLVDEHVERVWAALTQPELLVQWLAPGRIEPRVGGAAKLDFVDSGVKVDSAVTAVTPERLLEYSWSAPGEPVRTLRWMLEPVGPMTHLTLALDLPASEDAARSCAGWAAHLDMLIAALAGIPIKFPFEVFKDARAAYQARLTTA